MCVLAARRRYDSRMPHPVLISSWNGVPALDCTAAMLTKQADPLDALVAGIQLVEDDPEELSVGYGGLPNEDGEVELDAIVMHGPLHRSAAVAGVRRVRHVARLALEVLRRTDHSLIVGEGANKFARALGFVEENLLTEKSRKAWLDWKASLSTRDAWLSAAEWAGEKGASGDAARSGFGQALWAGNVDPAANQAVPTPTSALQPPHSPKPNDSRTASPIPHTYGTIHTSLLLAPGSDLYGCTSTSGLSYKLAGRVGDTACVGAGCYTDNAVGSAGATGRGEAVMQSCGAFAIVDAMASGLSPTEACLKVLKRIADHTKEKRLLDEKGRPGFNVTLYAVRKDGQYGCASMHEGYEFAVHSEGKTRLERAAFLFGK